MDEPREFPVPVASDEEVAAFITRYGTPYDPETDDYHREPFVADIREGKNDPIYNAHSYHTKVPPRAIIPYILHYTEPGDIILDPFCGSGMTGVAALMCENPPEDVFQAVPGAEIGARRAILNDLSPAACHIAYNYCTPVDVEALKPEFDRIKAAVKEEFDWLYGTEHYEAAVGLYEPTNPEVACRLKNPLPNTPPDSLISVVDREWELIDRGEVERRMGPEALAKQPLPEGVERFICIPATIKYTIWSDVYRCEGIVTILEPKGRASKKTGEASLQKVRRPRGCGADILLWEAGADRETGDVVGEFRCPGCGQCWDKAKLPWVTSIPVVVDYDFQDYRNRNRRTKRPITKNELDLIQSCKRRLTHYWHPSHEIYPFRELMTMSANKREVRRTSDFYTPRNLLALSCLWSRISSCASSREKSFLQFSITAIIPYCCRKQNYGGGGGGMSGTLYLPSFHQEKNVLEVWWRKVEKLEEHFEDWKATCGVLVKLGPAETQIPIDDSTVDYVFTDPPFGGNIFYSDASIMWESWLQAFTDENRETVYHRRSRSQRIKDGYVFKTLKDYEDEMRRAFVEMFRIMKPGRFATIEFNNSDGQVFEAIKLAARDAGFHIENMVFLDKVQKSFKQIKGEKGEQDVVGHDVIFNLRKPSVMSSLQPSREGDHPDGQGHSIEDLVGETIRAHLRSLPCTIEKDPSTYTDEHRTTPFLNTMLMNTLIPRGVDVSRLNLPFIDRVCGRYFRRVDGRWYLRDEAVGDDRPNGNKGRLFQIPDENVSIEDEKSAIAWLRQKLTTTPMRIGELRPHWMKATVKLTGDLSIQLECLLRENFWLDRSTRRWRIPTADELAELNDQERQRACHDAERFLEGKLSPHPTDAEILGWIEKLYSAAGRLEEEALGLVEPGEEPTLPADLVAYYRMMPRLLQSVLKENVDASAYTRASRQCRTAARKIQEHDDRKEAEAQSRSGPRQGKLFD